MMSSILYFPSDETLLLLLLVLIHATFQLGVSLLTLLSSHSLGRQRSLRQLLLLNIAYIVGGSIMLTILMIVGIFVMLTITRYASAHSVWLSMIGALLVVAITIGLWYFRKGGGTALWLPRVFASALTRRAKATSSLTDAALLGAIAVCVELPLSGVLILCAAYTLLQPGLLAYQPALVAAYSVGVALPLAVTTVLIAGGHRLSAIQRWRESNKSFLQYASAAGLLVIAFAIWIFFVYEKAAL